ncbi:hypothetical protein GR7B_00124 [Vibrio phage vB_VcorM_GR7B]|nr:hypothetical protein GR7B_00124 [Vibrio phage vB_VcorM_GR7B]
MKLTAEEAMFLRTHIVKPEGKTMRDVASAICEISIEPVNSYPSEYRDAVSGLLEKFKSNFESLRGETCASFTDVEDYKFDIFQGRHDGSSAICMLVCQQCTISPSGFTYTYGIQCERYTKPKQDPILQINTKVSIQSHTPVIDTFRLPNLRQEVMFF